MTKSGLVLLAGVAHQRGLLPDVDRPVAARLPAIGFDTPHNAPITRRRLLGQTSDWEGSCLGLPDQMALRRKVAHAPRSAGGLTAEADPPPLQAPDSYRDYNDVRNNQLSLALLNLFRVRYGCPSNPQALAAVGARPSVPSSQVNYSELHKTPSVN